MINILFIFCGIFLALLLRAGYISYLSQTPFVPKPDTTKLAPPTQAYTGTIKSLSGDVKKFARNAEDFTLIDKNQPVVQGEIVATGNDATMRIAMERMDDILIDLEENTEVEFSNLVYPAVLLRHRRGTATYITTTSSFSVRSLHALMELGTGRVTVTTNDQTVNVHLQEGVAKVAMIDANNDTHVWELKEGQKAIIDDEARAVRITK